MGAEAFVAAQIVDFAGATDDRVASLLVAGSGISLAYNDGAGTLTIASTVSPTWGSIGGTLSSQTDLQTALNGKAATTHTHVIADTTGLQAALDAKIGGNVGSTNNRIVRASGTGGLTVKTSGVEIDDSGRLLVDTIWPLTQGGVVLGYGTGNVGAISVNQYNVTLASATGILWSSTTNLASGADLGIYRIGSGQLDFRGSSFRFRNYANSANAPVVCSEIDFGSNLGFDRKIVPRSYGVTIPGGSVWDGSFVTGNNRVTLNTGVSLCYDAAGGTDLELARGGTTYDTANLDVRAANGLRVRNRANSADAPISASSAVFSALVTVGTYTVATLPSAAANAGALAQVTDSSVTANGSVVAGSGSNRVIVFSNGTNWDVVVA